MTGTQEEARAAAERFIAGLGSQVEEGECTLDPRASDSVALTFDCVYTENLYPGLSLDVPYEEERQVRIQGTLGPSGEFAFAFCRLEDFKFYLKEFYFTFADC